MSKTDVRTLLTSGQVAVVLHKSTTTIARWVRDGDLEAVAQIAVGRGVYLFDPEVIKQKALDLALDTIPGQTLDLEIVDVIEPRGRAAS
jgi:hypothetical protein